MSIALYRKYRPGTFGKVRGQEHVTEPLRQALRNGRVNHAYLFSGPRGCGKTASARILARSLNCVDGPTPDPCEECESCVALAPNGEGSIDVIEIDAASHGGVDDARELRERAFFAPVNSRYKVYIIDEAHMVTREGFNALLKLVEEPPPHLKFVFATTEPDKVISTIRSRTHHYPFRLIPPSTLRELLEEILTGEGVPFDPAALPLVVRAGGGSARDSLSILDQLLAGSDEAGITREGAVALLGYTDSGVLSEMVDALGARDGAAVFELIDRIIDAGNDPRRFTADLLERVRDLVVLASVPDALDKGLINVEPEAAPRMREQAERIGAAELTRAAEVLNRGLTEMRGATSPRLLLELLCSRVILPDAGGGGGTAGDTGGTTGATAGGADAEEMLERLRRLERRVASQPAPPPGPPPESGAGPAPSAGERGPAPRPEAAEGSAASPPPAADREPERARSARSEDGWPETARPGAATAASASIEPVRNTAGSATSFDAHLPAVVERLAANRKPVVRALIRDGVQAAVLEGGTLTLYFDTEGRWQSFKGSGKKHDVAVAVQEVTGLEVEIEAAVGMPEAPVSPSATPPPPAPSPPAAEPSPQVRPEETPAGEGPGSPPDSGSAPPATASPPDLPDTAPDEENGGPAPEPAPERKPAGGARSAPPEESGGAGEQDGLALIQRELGGTVIEEIDHG